VEVLISLLHVSQLLQGFILSFKVRKSSSHLLEEVRLSELADVVLISCHPRVNTSRCDSLQTAKPEPNLLNLPIAPSMREFRVELAVKRGFFPFVFLIIF
jgi:hypothetical protein